MLFRMRYLHISRPHITFDTEKYRTARFRAKSYRMAVRVARKILADKLKWWGWPTSHRYHLIEVARIVVRRKVTVIPERRTTIWKAKKSYLKK